MREKKWAVWGALGGALLGLTFTAGVAVAVRGDFGAGLLVACVVAIFPASAALGAVLGLDAAALCGPRHRAPTPRLTPDVEQIARARFGGSPRPAEGIRGEA
jgi:hypothetical protein